VSVVGAALPSACVCCRSSSRTYRWQRVRTLTDRRSTYLHWLLTDGASARKLRLFDPDRLRHACLP